MVIWKVRFALGAGQEEEIDLSDVEDLVDWDPEFQGRLISSFFDTDYHWLLALKTVIREDVEFPSKNFLLIVGRKWGEDKSKTVPLGVLFEFSEGDLKLRAVGPQSVAAQAGGDNNLLLDLVNELFDFPQRWRSKSVICGISKQEWRKIADIIGEEPWRLIDSGRRALSTDPRKAISEFQKAFQIFSILADLNGQFHAMFAQLEVALDSKNFSLAKEHLEVVRQYSLELDNPMLEENVYSTEGIILYEENNFQQAVSVFENALEKAKKANMHSHVVNAHLNIGECYYRLANYDSALKNFDIARGYAEERNDKLNLAISQINIAKVLCQNLKMGDVSSDVQATHYLTEATEYFEKSDDKRNLMLAYHTFGNLEDLKQNYNGAMIYYEHAAEIAQSLNDTVLHDFYFQKVQAMRSNLY
jgi:tetratricopeptide (TPR) repeat protein